MKERISAQDAIAFARSPGRYGLIDVRSEGEVAAGALPGFQNLPILRDAERHEVGLTYKLRGQAEAVELGHRLVGPHRAARVLRWTETIESSRERGAVVTCWRGGMRSGIAASWIRESGHRAVTVEGGYKAIRSELLRVIDSPPPLRVLSGMTGSGKTEFIAGLAGSGVSSVDLEAMARHRGSSFGLRPRDEQPAQATFENQLGMALWGGSDRTWLVEDESRLIGRISIPNAFRDAMARAPVVLLEATDEERVTRIRREYVDHPLAQGIPATEVLEHLLTSVEGIRRRLGGERADQVLASIRAAFVSEDPSAHDRWILLLLHEYYDRAYRYAFSRHTREIVFRGDARACREWLIAGG